MSYKALICITTCNRLSEVKKYILPYVNFCNKEKSFSFLLSLDGNNKEYIDFCNEFKIPLLYSDEREGVGLSKNRVLTQFPNFDYYFFIEDDIELAGETIFELFINVFKATNYHHFSFSHLANATRKETIGDSHLTHNNLGGGQFNFYSKYGLEQVGGWNTCFAKYKRYGHTEHTYRFYHANLTPSPFVFIDEAREMMIIHDPPHVTAIKKDLENPVSELIYEEEDLIKQKTTFFPLATISPFHFNGYDINYSDEVAAFLKKSNGKYPLVKGVDRLKCFGEYYFFKFTVSKSFFNKLIYFFGSFICYPLNNQIKHFIKRKMGLV